MKTSKFLTLILSFVAIIAMTSCVEDDDYTVPNTLGTEENLGLNEILADLADGTLIEISIADLKAQFVGDTELIESNIVVKGYVSSSDATGNFFKEFYIQDAPENPTAAIGVVLNQVDTYNQFNFGREVYIKLNGLYLGENSSDIVTVGGRIDGGDVEQMTSNQIPVHLFRSTVTTQIVPLVLNPGDVNDSHLGVFAMFENMQFPSSLQGETFVDPFDDFDTQRALVSCADGSGFALETSSFASFDQVPLPTNGRGSIAGLITQGFGGSPRVMVLNSVNDINFSDNRCDPFYEESFASGNITDNWTTFSVTGTQEWYFNNFGNPSNSATMSGFVSGSGAQENEDWLVSNAIDMSSVSGASLSFQTVKRFNGPDLEVYFSTNYTGGDPTNTANGTWTQLNPTLDTNTGSWSSWTSSGGLDVSAAAGGNIFIAYKYTSTSSSSATWEVDNISLSEL